MLKEDFLIFIVSLFIGLLFVYSFNDPPKIIVKHQNLDQHK